MLEPHSTASRIAKAVNYPCLEGKGGGMGGSTWLVLCDHLLLKRKIKCDSSVQL